MEHLLLDSVDCSSSRFQSAPTSPRQFSLEDALVVRMRTPHHELQSLQFLQHGVHTLWRHECPTSEVGIREPGLFI